jgi:hypothetical protein
MSGSMNAVSTSFASRSRRADDTFFLTGDRLARAQQVLRVAEHQVRLAQYDAGPDLQDALVNIEGSISGHLVRIRDAIADGQSDAEDSSARDAEQRAWFTSYRSAD